MSDFPTDSSGQLIRQAQIARDDGANPQLPSLPVEIFDGRIINASQNTSGTNANQARTIDDGWGDLGLDDPILSIEDSQSIEGLYGDTDLENGQYDLLEDPPGYDPTDPSTWDDYYQGSDGNNPPINSGGSPGTGAPNDDSPTKNTTRTTIDNLFAGAQNILPDANILDQYASYTYTASVYMMDVAGYQRLLRTKKKNITGYALLFQSGGAPSNTAGSPSPLQFFEKDGTATSDGGLLGSTSGRNPYFTNDYYIDSIEVKSTVAGKGTGSPHNVNEMNFTVVEPYGISLIQNLNSAITQYIYKGNVNDKQGNPGSGLQPYGAQNYLMVIKFYGYDDAGNLVRGGRQKPDGSTDTNAFVEKFIPFQIGNLTFKIANKAVEYQFTCTTPANIINTGSARGTIPYNIELAATTLKEALAGATETTITTPTDVSGWIAEQDSPPEGTTPPVTPAAQEAPPNISAAPTNKSTTTQGLMAALNRYQFELVKNGTYSIADEYYVEFASPAIAQARIKSPGNTDKKNIAMSKGGSAADQLDPAKQSADVSTFTVRAIAGMQVIKFIEQLTRNSTYIKDQQTVSIDPVTGKQSPNGKPANTMAWFKIGLEAEPIAFDTKRNDYAYRMTFVISPYRVVSTDSAYFPTSTFYGVHKRYPYWFTGENTAVLNYEQSFNNLYHRIMTGAAQIDSRTSSVTEIQKRVFQPRSDQSSQGADGRTNEPAANAADYLYSPEDQSEVKMTIVGDPAWIFQQEVAFGASANTFTVAPFLSDGTINIEAGKVYFEVAFNLPQDYNMSKGIIDPGSATNGVESQGQNKALQSYVYDTIEITSNFNRGKFTQDLVGNLFYFNKASAADRQATYDLADTINAAASNISNWFDSSQARSADLLTAPGAVRTIGSTNSDITSDSVDTPQYNNTDASSFDPNNTDGNNAGGPNGAVTADQQVVRPQSGSQLINVSDQELQSTDAYLRAREDGVDEFNALDIAAAAYTQQPVLPDEPYQLVVDSNPG